MKISKDKIKLATKIKYYKKINCLMIRADKDYYFDVSCFLGWQEDEEVDKDNFKINLCLKQTKKK